MFANAPGILVTGASQLGGVDGFEYFALPGTAREKFDQFPGAPSPTGAVVTFKANWVDENGGGQTGVYFRDVTADIGESPTGVIAQRGMDIPDGGGTPGSGATFGSTATPSTAGNKVVFTGLDNEDAPTAGGIYIANIESNPALKPLVDFSSGVPGETNETFNRFGEGLSFDGKKVAFWGAWGTETRTVTLTCRGEGNGATVAACRAASDKDPNTGEPTGTTTRQVPVNQGIFTVDFETNEIVKVAEVGEDGIAELQVWHFSGNPDVNEEEEAPRSRSSAFAALEGDKVVFKATDENGVDALLLRNAGKIDLETVLSTMMFGDFLDSLSPFEAMIVELGIERDGLRGGRLAVNASFENAAGDSWAGVYLSGQVTPIPLPAGLPLLAAALGLLGFARRRR